MNTIDLPSVGRAIERMREKYPKESISIKLEVRSNESVLCVATVEDVVSADYTIGFGNSPESAVDSLFYRAGDRNPEALRQAKIDALKKQIEELQGKVEQEHGMIVAQV